MPRWCVSYVAFAAEHPRVKTALCLTLTISAYICLSLSCLAALLPCAELLCAEPSQVGLAEMPLRCCIPIGVISAVDQRSGAACCIDISIDLLTRPGERVPPAPPPPAANWTENGPAYWRPLKLVLSSHQAE